MKFLPIFKKEIKTYFVSPIVYVVALIFSLIIGFIFSLIVGSYNIISMRATSYPYGGFSLNPTEMIGLPTFHNMAITILFISCLLTMRLFSDEKKTDTIELLFTYPLRDIDIVIGKLFACLSIFVGMVSISVIYFLILEKWINFDKLVLLNGYIGLILLGVSFISIGIFVSSLTENQIVSATITFGLALLFWLIGWVSEIAGPKWHQFFTYISLLDHYENFPKGILDTKDLVYYLTFSVFFNFLTLKILSSKKYRG